MALHIIYRLTWVGSPKIIIEFPCQSAFYGLEMPIVRVSVYIALVFFAKHRAFHGVAKTVVEKSVIRKLFGVFQNRALFLAKRAFTARPTLAVKQNVGVYRTEFLFR